MIRVGRLLTTRFSTTSTVSCSPLRAGFATSAIIKMKIHPVPVRDDNYAYIVQSSVDGKAVFVDPYDVPTVHKAASSLGISDDNIVGLLTTHHHHDHSGGNETFASTFPNRPIFGGSNQIPALTNQVKDSQKLNDLLQGVEITCLATPCHTQDHICYHSVTAVRMACLRAIRCSSLVAEDSSRVNPMKCLLRWINSPPSPTTLWSTVVMNTQRPT